MLSITHGPMGKIIRGHVLDSCPKYVEQALRDYDTQLYLKWNPTKLRGHGCWEVRWKPEFKSVKPEDVVVYKGNTIVCPKYHEIGLNNHVMDVPFVNYNVLERIKKMDTWTHKETGYKGKDLTRVLDYNEAKHDEKLEDKMVTELDYNLKQHKAEIRWFREFVNSGGNPYRLADSWK